MPKAVSLDDGLIKRLDKIRNNHKTIMGKPISYSVAIRLILRRAKRKAQKAEKLNKGV